MKKNALKLFGNEVLEEAEGFAGLCREGRRWGGNALLIVLDACLDSTGLNYFTVVVPRVKKFRELYIENGEIVKCSDFGKIKRRELMDFFGNERVWNVMDKICGFISANSGRKEIKTLKAWAEKANPLRFKGDEIGGVKGVGINTFQYLRIQSGVDTVMPDKVILRWINRNFGGAKTPYEGITEGKRIADKLGVSQTALCWAIWIKESGELNRISVE